MTEIMPSKRRKATPEASLKPPPDYLAHFPSGFNLEQSAIPDSRRQPPATSIDERKKFRPNPQRRRKYRSKEAAQRPSTRRSPVPNVSNNHTTPRHTTNTESITMSPISPAEHTPTTSSSRSRPPSYHIQVAKPYIFQQTIDQCLRDLGVSQTREDNIRLAGVQWIDNVRRALRL